jgi:hypothetical protein
MKILLSLIFTFVLSLAAYGQTTECTYTFAPPAQYVAAKSDTYGVNVRSQVGCSQTAQSNDSFLRITNRGLAGTVDGQWIRSILVAIEANTGAARTGTVTIGGQTYTFYQASADKSRKRVRILP